MLTKNDEEGGVRKPPKELGPFMIPVKLRRVSVETILPDVQFGPKLHQIICGNRYQH